MIQYFIGYNNHNDSYIIALCFTGLRGLDSLVFVRQNMNLEKKYLIFDTDFFIQYCSGNGKFVFHI